ncbi:winged helix-turn-helix domain-containing protein (plasmid) [Haloarcula sp. NS06]|uniref:winged helix-turn-helix domain-containing protein n=1 Tax=Haloarcula sp. NS06 TaxID=3409688 RepID=UPI003DA76BD2
MILDLVVLLRLAATSLINLPLFYKNPPQEASYDAPAWSTALAQQYLIEAFDVAFSRRHVRRLMHKAKVSPKIPSQTQPQPMRPTIGVSASRKGVNLLGAVTEHEATAVLECSGSFTGRVMIRFLTISGWNLVTNWSCY